MKKQIPTALMILTLAAAPALASDQSTRAAIGGGLGGALGALIGSEVGGRTGAIVGGGLGAATGSAVATDGYQERRYYTKRYYYAPERRYRYRHRHHEYHWDD